MATCVIPPPPPPPLPLRDQALAQDPSRCQLRARAGPWGCAGGRVGRGGGTPARVARRRGAQAASSLAVNCPGVRGDAGSTRGQLPRCIAVCCASQRDWLQAPLPVLLGYVRASSRRGCEHSLAVVAGSGTRSLNLSCSVRMGLTAEGKHARNGIKWNERKRAGPKRLGPKGNRPLRKKRNAWSAKLTGLVTAPFVFCV